MTIVAGLFVALFGRLLGRWKGSLVPLIGVALYTLLVGAGAGVVRAALMGGLGVFGRQLGRRQDSLNSPAFVAGLMALFNPNVLWNICFQLSAMATLGLILYVTPLTQTFISLLTVRWSLSTPLATRLDGPVGEYFLIVFISAGSIPALNRKPGNSNKRSKPSKPDKP